MNAINYIFQYLTPEQKNLWLSDWKGPTGTLTQKTIRNKIGKIVRLLEKKIPGLYCLYYKRFTFENIPDYIKKTLRREVQFVCPVSNCQSPFLTWHHFDPPQHLGRHNDANGIVALCHIHHDMADQGTYTKDQLRAFKNKSQKKIVRDKFEWLRYKIIVAAAGAFHYEPRNGNILLIDHHPIIFLKRDADGYLLLNIYLGLIQGSSLIIKDNWWIVLESPDDVECSPSGHLLKVKFKGGNYFEIKFIEHPTKEHFLKSFGLLSLPSEEIKFPLLVIQINLEIKEMDLSFKSHRMKNFTNNFILWSEGINIAIKIESEKQIFSNAYKKMIEFFNL